MWKIRYRVLEVDVCPVLTSESDFYLPEANLIGKSDIESTTFYCPKSSSTLDLLTGLTAQSSHIN